MPIEFPCPQCGSTLRTPDGTTGKQAKCPQCQAVAVIPAASNPGAGDGENPFAKPAASPSESSNPFSAPGSGSSASSPFAAGYQDSANPYASPREAEAAVTTYHVGELVHRRLDFGDVAGTTWRIFSENFGMMLLGGLVMLGVLFGWNIISTIVTAIAQAALGIGPFANGGPGGPPAINDIGSLIGYIILQFVTGMVGIVVWAFLQAGMSLYMLDAPRGNPLQVGKIFTGGKYILRIFGFNFLTFLVIYGAVGIWFLIAVLAAQQNETRILVGVFGGGITVIALSVVLLMLGFTPLFIVDRNEGIFSAMKNSWQFMKGNFLVVFGLYIVMTLLCFLVTLFTCLIGYFGALPFLLLLQVMMYFMATGQPVVEQKKITRDNPAPDFS